MFGFQSRQSNSSIAVLPNKSSSEQLELDDEAIIEEKHLKGHKCRVQYQGSIWPAQCISKDITLKPGETVCIVGRKGLTLFFK